MAFFSKGEEERMLNRLLLDRGVERICLDSRPLFSCISSDPAVLHAQSKNAESPATSGCVDAISSGALHRASRAGG